MSVKGIGRHLVLCFVCSDLDEILAFETQAEADAFASGFSAGCEQFGGDGWAVSDNLHGNLEEYGERSGHEALAKIQRAIIAHLAGSGA